MFLKQDQRARRPFFLRSSFFVGVVVVGVVVGVVVIVVVVTLYTVAFEVVELGVVVVSWWCTLCTVRKEGGR